MYDPRETLALIDSNVWPILLVCGFAMIMNYVWFIAAYRTANREGVYSIPLFCTFYWLAHDSSLLYRYDKWFNGYDHWFMKLFWVAFLGAVAFAIAFVLQDNRLARHELLPGASKRRFAGFMALGIVSGYVLWEAVKYILDDDLYILGFGLTIASYPVMGAALLLRRRSALGQSPMMWAAASLNGASYFLATILWFGDAFRQLPWIALGVFAVGGELAMTWVVWRMRGTGATFGMVAPADGAAEPVLARGWPSGHSASPTPPS